MTEVKSLLTHLKEQSIDHYVKQFQESRLLNPNKDKDVEDVIRLYWFTQDTDQYKKHIVNPIQQILTNIFKTNPTLIDKLYRCRSQFIKQQHTYTESVRAILKFGKYPYFTTEWDSSVQCAYSDVPLWYDTLGLNTKQCCILVAHDETTFVKSMVAGDDHTYAVGLSKMWKMISTAANLNYIPINDHNDINATIYGSFAFIENSKSNTVQDVNRRNEKIADRYSIVYGDPFSTAAFKDRTDVQYTYSGVVSRYGLIETHCLNTEYYRQVLQPYLTHPDLGDENRQLYTYTWSRFDNIYDKILRAMVDRAMMVIHQTMVDLMISIHEDAYTLPQLSILYAPGTIIKTQNACKYTQASTVLNTKVSYNGSEVILGVIRLLPINTKMYGVFRHVDDLNECIKNNRYDNPYVNTLSPTKHRGGTVFKYFTSDDRFSLIKDDDVSKLLPCALAKLKMSFTPVQKYLQGLYYHRTMDRGYVTTEKVEYTGRLIVDPTRNQSKWYDNADKYQISAIDEDTYLKHNTCSGPGLNFVYHKSTENDPLILTIHDLYSDLGYLLSLPVMNDVFILKDKKWAEVYTLDLKDVEYQKDAYKQLTAPDKVKNFILTMSKYQDQNYFKDLIEDKEGGCIFLLCGDSSTGKTLTVEAIAELLERPLYSITAGELGTESYEIDDRLETILNRATKWNSIVLIDEADVFLSKRDDTSITKNAIISVFLRQLEYFKGVLFLTSNRLSAIDDAFLNRITEIIEYDSLTDKELADIWVNLCAKQSLELTPTDANKLAKYVTNGRQIKNLIKMSIAMSLRDNVKLTIPYLIDFVKTHVKK